MNFNLTYINGIRTAIDFQKNDSKIHDNVKKALFEYCPYKIPQYEKIPSVKLLCAVVVDYAIYREHSEKQVETFLNSKLKIIPNFIKIIPIDSNDSTNSYFYLKYNKDILDNSFEKIIALKNTMGVLVSIINKKTTLYKEAKIINIKTIPTTYNDYELMIYTDISEKPIKISANEFMSKRLEINDNILIHLYTYDIINLDIHKKYTFSFKGYRCKCGNELIIECDRVICGSKYTLCKFDYETIIKTNLSIRKDKDLNDLYKIYRVDYSLKEFLRYLLSLKKINYYELTDYQKCLIFNIKVKDIKFKNLNIYDSLNQLTYCQGICVRHKIEYIEILKGLYND